MQKTKEVLALRWKSFWGHLVLPTATTVILYFALSHSNEVVELRKTLRLFDSIWTWLTLIPSISDAKDGIYPTPFSHFLSELNVSNRLLLYSCWIWIVTIVICTYAALLHYLWTNNWTSAWTQFQKAKYRGTLFHKLFERELSYKQRQLNEAYMATVKDAAQNVLKHTIAETYFDKITFFAAALLILPVWQLCLIALALLLLPSLYIALLLLAVAIGPLALLWSKLSEGDWSAALITLLIYVGVGFGLIYTLALHTTLFVILVDLVTIAVSGLVLFYLTKQFGFKLQDASDTLLRQVLDSIARTDPTIRTASHRQEKYALPIPSPMRSGSVSSELDLDPDAIDEEYLKNASKYYGLHDDIRSPNAVTQTWRLRSDNGIDVVAFLTCPQCGTELSTPVGGGWDAPAKLECRRCRQVICTTET